MTRKNLISIYLPLLTFIVLVIGVWLPFGFKTIGIFEEWHIRAFLLSGQNVYFILPDSALAAFASRPFAFLPFAVAHHLSPDSFLGFNLLQMGFFIGKGYLTYLILRRMLPHHMAFAFLVAVLFVFHPADTLVYTFRTINIHGAVMLYLIAVYLLMLAYENPRWWLVLLMWIVLASSLLIYEVSYPIVAFTPFVLVWMARGVNRRIIALSVLWYLAPLLTGIYYIYVLLSLGSAQLYQTAGREFSTIPQVFEAIWKIYTHSFIDSWRQIQFSSPYVLIALILSGLVFATSLFLMGRPSRQPVAMKRYLSLGGIGTVIIFVGFAFYLVFAQYHLETQRTYYISALGAAIATGILLYLIVARKQFIFSVTMTVIIGFALLNGLNQHRYFFDIAMRQQRFLGQLLEQVPSIEGKQTIFIYENTNLLITEDTFFHTNATLSYALRYLYNNPAIEAVICYTFESDSYMYKTSGLDKAPCPSPSNMVVFEYSYENELKLVSDVIKRESNPPTVFTCWPIENCTLSFSEIIPVAPVALDFDQTHFLGDGWSLPAKQDNITYRWTIQRESKLVLSIGDEASYKVGFQLYSRGVDPDGPDLFINDTPITLTNSEGNYFEAVIPVSVVQQEVDVLRFVSDELSPTGVGFGIDWLKIEPFIPNKNALIEFDTTLSGAGWRGAELTEHGTTFQWSVKETAGVNLGFLAQQDYWVEVNPMLILEPNTLDDVELWVESTQLDSLYSPDTKRITARLPQELVQETEVTVLQIKVPQLVPDQTGAVNLGVAIDQIRVEPLIRSDHVQIEFDEPITGTGWRGAETTSEGVTFQWSIEETASIDLGFLVPQDYRIEVLPIMILEPNTFKDVEFWVGQSQLNSEVDTTTGQLIAKLPRSLIEDDVTTVLQIRVPQLIRDMTGAVDLGIAIDRITILSDTEGAADLRSN